MNTNENLCNSCFSGLVIIAIASSFHFVYQYNFFLSILLIIVSVIGMWCLIKSVYDQGIEHGKAGRKKPKRLNKSAESQPRLVVNNERRRML